MFMLLTVRRRAALRFKTDETRGTLNYWRSGEYVNNVNNLFNLFSVFSLSILFEIIRFADAIGLGPGIV